MSDVLKQILEKKKKTGNVNPVMEKQLKEEDKELKEILLNRLLENPYQPRIEIKTDEIKELAGSIKEQGLIQPILVTKAVEEGCYYIIAGHRRAEAFKLLGRKKIKAYMIKADLKQLASLSIVENLQREDLNVIETAMALKRYKEKFNKTLEEIGREIGKTKSWVSQVLNILKLPDLIIYDIKENKSTKDITALSWINSYAKKIKNKKFSVLNKSKKPHKSDVLEEAFSQKWENEVFLLYQNFLKNGREWLKKEIEKRLKENEAPKAKIEIKITKKHGITIKINEHLNLDDDKKKIFEVKLQNLIEDFV